MRFRRARSDMVDTLVVLACPRYLLHGVDVDIRLFSLTGLAELSSFSLLFIDLF